MTKTTIIAAVVALGAVAVFFFLFGNNSKSTNTADTCPTGYALVGEGCVTLQEECELQGDSYYYDEAQQQCLSR